jgi:hypothetical protein
MLIMSPFLSQIASADEYSDWVFGPTAVHYDCTDPTYFMGIQNGGVVIPSCSKKLDGFNAVMIEGSWLRTWDFTSTDVADYRVPYANRTDFPPNNVSIDWVYVLAYVQIASGTIAQFALTLEENSSGNVTTVISTNTYATSTYPTAITFDVTNHYDWTPSVLNNHTLISTKLTLTNVQGGSFLGVDYLGLNYRWYYNETRPPAGPGPGPGFPALTINVPSLLGVIGFIGMIGALPIGVWYYRKTEGSRVRVAVFVFIAIIICYALFLAGSNA